MVQTIDGYPYFPQPGYQPMELLGTHVAGGYTFELYNGEVRVRELQSLGFRFDHWRLEETWWDWWSGDTLGGALSKAAKAALQHIDKQEEIASVVGHAES